MPPAGRKELTQEAVLKLGGRREGTRATSEGREPTAGFDRATQGLEGAQCSRGVAFSPPPSSLPSWAPPLLRSWLNAPFLQEAFLG